MICVLHYDVIAGGDGASERDDARSRRILEGKRLTLYSLVEVWSHGLDYATSLELYCCELS